MPTTRIPKPEQLVDRAKLPHHSRFTPWHTRHHIKQAKGVAESDQCSSWYSKETHSPSKTSRGYQKSTHEQILRQWSVCHTDVQASRNGLKWYQAHTMPHLQHQNVELSNKHRHEYTRTLCRNLQQTTYPILPNQTSPKWLPPITASAHGNTWHKPQNHN